MADLVCILYALNDDTEESEVTERVGHGDTETPSFCWLGKRRSLCLSGSMAYLVCILYARNDYTDESEVTEGVGHGDTDTPSLCWLRKSRSLCLCVSMAYLLCVLRPLRVSVSRSR